MLGVPSPHELKHGRKIQQNFVLKERLKECVLDTRKGASRTKVQRLVAPRRKAPIWQAKARLFSGKGADVSYCGRHWQGKAQESLSKGLTAACSIHLRPRQFVLGF